MWDWQLEREENVACNFAIFVNSELEEECHKQGKERDVG